MSTPLAIADLAVRPATLDDVPVVRSILVEAAVWLHSRGIEQWPLDWQTAEQNYLRERVEHGELYLAVLDGEPIATLVLQWSDPRMWGEQEPDAGYVHRLAVRRAYAGRGVGSALLAWAAANIVAAGRTFLRLDCMADNAGLCRFYQKLGFSDRGLVTNDRWSGRLYEQPASQLVSWRTTKR